MIVKVKSVEVCVTVTCVCASRCSGTLAHAPHLHRVAYRLRIMFVAEMIV